MSHSSSLDASVTGAYLLKVLANIQSPVTNSRIQEPRQPILGLPATSVDDKGEQIQNHYVCGIKAYALCPLANHIKCSCR